MFLLYNLHWIQIRVVEDDIKGTFHVPPTLYIEIGVVEYWILYRELSIFFLR